MKWGKISNSPTDPSCFQRCARGLGRIFGRNLIRCIFNPKIWLLVRTLSRIVSTLVWKVVHWHFTLTAVPQQNVVRWLWPCCQNKIRRQCRIPDLGAYCINVTLSCPKFTNKLTNDE